MSGVQPKYSHLTSGKQMGKSTLIHPDSIGLAIAKLVKEVFRGCP